MICGKCGANVPDGYEFCMKCGAKIDISQADSTASAVVETKPEKKGINKKVLIPVVAAIVIVLTVVAILFGMKGAAEKNGYFANIPWGTDMETVQKKVAKALNGKQTANSGATKFVKGDINVNNFLLECKTVTKEQNTFTLHREWFEKNKEEDRKSVV